MGCCCHGNGHGQADTKVLKVGGMTCGHCKMAVEKAVSAFKGVDSVNADVSAGNVTVKFDPQQVDLAHIIKTIEDQGYNVEK